jgi:hypothetical protein
MASERQLGGWCEEARHGAVRRIGWWQYKNRFRVAELACDGLHRCSVESIGVEHYSQRISVEPL